MSPSPELATWRVTLTEPNLDAEEVAAVGEVLASRWLSVGPVTRAFEVDLAAALAVPEAVMVSSGTAALHCAVLALDLSRGDEVVVPSLSFVASASVIALCGATPVFADVRSDRDLTVDTDDVAGLLSERTRAIVAMHYGGFAADVRALVDLAVKRGLAVIEDAAHAPVVDHGGVKLGTVGDVGCFSFHAAKNVTTGEGGAVVARDGGLLARVRGLRSHCVTTVTEERHRPGGDYDVDGFGLNYRPTEIASALGRVQLRKLGADRERRKMLVAAYRRGFADVPGLTVPFADRDGDSAHHLMAVLLPVGAERTLVRARLRDAGVQTSVHYPPTHRFTQYREAFDSARRPLPVTDGIAGRLLSLPLHARMTLDDVALVVTALAESLRRPTA